MKRCESEAREEPRPADTSAGDSDANSESEVTRRGAASAGLKRVANAFRRAANSDERPAAEPPPAGQVTPAAPDDNAARDGGRKAGWPSQSTVADVTGKLASKLRPETSFGDVRRPWFSKIPRTVLGFAIGLAIGWIVVTIYTIQTEFQDVRAAAAPERPPALDPGAPAIPEPPAEGVVLAQRGDDRIPQPVDDGEETAEAGVAIPDVPLSLVVESASGGEDTEIPLTISTTRVGEQVAEGLAITVAGLPEGARLSAGEDGGGGTWVLDPEQLDGLMLSPPPDYSGRFELSVAAADRGAGGAGETATARLVVYVGGVADPPSLETRDARGRQGRPIPLSIAAASGDRDGSESLSLIVSGLPENAALSSGTDQGRDGWVLSRDQLDGLMLQPPAGFTGRLDLAVAAIALEADGDRATATAPLAVRVTGGGNHLILGVEDAMGDQGRPVPLDIDAKLAQSDGSEQLSIVVSQLPEGATLSAGRPAQSGSWSLASDELAGLSLLPPSDYSGRFQLRVAATVRQGDGNVVTATAPLAVDVARAPKAAPEPAPLPALVAPAQAAPPPQPAADKTLNEAAETLRSLKGEPVAPAEPAAVEAVDTQQAQTNPDARAYMARGDKLMALGDVAAARLFFELAVEHGAVRAATALAKTYDPAYLKELGVLGVRGDPDKAMAWYKRAVAGGDGEAARRLEALNR